MSDKSPLFVSALELLAHGTELYSAGNHRKHKFVILHLANAIELILKDLLIDKGVSIYKGPKETLTIWSAFSELERVGVTIPERPVIELLIDDRNTIQHRFGFPNAESVYYYLENVTAFFKRFLLDHYGLPLAETLAPYLSEQQLELLGLTRGEYAFLADLMRLSPEAAIVQAYRAVERETLKFITPFLSSLHGRPDFMFWRQPVFRRFVLEMERQRFLNEGALQRFLELRSARNYAAHVDIVEGGQVDWPKALATAQEFLSGLAQAARAGLKFPELGDETPSEEVEDAGT